jgi:hypothetical protein
VSISSGVPRGKAGFGGFNPPPPRNSEILPKLSRIPSSVEYTSVTTYSEYGFHSFVNWVEPRFLCPLSPTEFVETSPKKNSWCNPPSPPKKFLGTSLPINCTFIVYSWFHQFIGMAAGLVGDSQLRNFACVRPVSSVRSTGCCCEEDGDRIHNSEHPVLVYVSNYSRTLTKIILKCNTLNLF